MCDRISNQFYGRWLQFNVDTNWNGIIVIEVISGGVVAPDHDLLLTYCAAPTPTCEFHDRWDSVQLLNFWKSLLLRLNCRSVLHFKASNRPQWQKKWDVYEVIYNLAIWSNSARFAGWQKRIASGVATTWTANDLNHSHQIPILLTLPQHSKSDHTSNNLLATLFWPTRTPVRAPEHNTMTKWLLPLPPNTHITCTAAAIADPLNILFLWNCKTGEEELSSLLHRELSIWGSVRSGFGLSPEWRQNSSSL